MNEKDLQTVYRLTFGDETGKDVVEDLERFCFGSITTFSVANKEDGSIDPYQLARLEGRREVLTRIMNFLKIDLSDLYDDYIEKE